MAEVIALLYQENCCRGVCYKSVPLYVHAYISYVVVCIIIQIHIHMCIHTNMQTCQHTQRESEPDFLHILACHHHWVVTSCLLYFLYRHQILQQRHQIWSTIFQPLLVVEQRHLKGLRRRFYLTKNFVIIISQYTIHITYNSVGAINHD